MPRGRPFEGRNSREGSIQLLCQTIEALPMRRRSAEGDDGADDDHQRAEPDAPR
jgi:hypothetical protein